MEIPSKAFRVQSGTTVQLIASLVGGACFTIGLWFMMSTSVVSRYPVTWVYGAMLFVLSGGTLLTTITVYAMDQRNMAVKIYALCMCVAMMSYSIAVMISHPLTVSPLPCPAGTYGAPDQTACLPCQCLNGDCDHGRDGTGECFCYGRWAGDICDECDAHVREGTYTNGIPSCDFCDPGWNYASNCTSCYPGYVGANCDSCDTHVQRYRIDKSVASSDPVLSLGGLNPWFEPRQDMIIMSSHEADLPTIADSAVASVMRCDGCVGNRNTRFCVEPDCTRMDPNAVIKLNDMPPEVTLSDTVCYDDHECEYSWLCVKMNPYIVTGVCASLSRESFGCVCGSIGAVEPNCLFCDQISISSCGEGTCTWAPKKGGTPLEGQVECACKENWNRYPKDLTDRSELEPGTTNVLNASCTLYNLEEETSCMDTTYGKHCIPCDCGNRGTCDDGISGSGNCTCVLDSVFGGRGMWEGEKCDQCFNQCAENLRDADAGCVPKCDDPAGYEEGRMYCLGSVITPCVFRQD